MCIKLLASQASLRGPYLCAVCPVLQWGKGEGGRPQKMLASQDPSPSPAGKRQNGRFSDLVWYDLIIPGRMKEEGGREA